MTQQHTLPHVQATTVTGHKTYVPVWLPVRHRTPRYVAVHVPTLGAMPARKL